MICEGLHNPGCRNLTASPPALPCSPHHQLSCSSHSGRFMLNLIFLAFGASSAPIPSQARLRSSVQTSLLSLPSLSVKAEIQRPAEHREPCLFPILPSKHAHVLSVPRSFLPRFLAVFRAQKTPEQRCPSARLLGPRALYSSKDSHAPCRTGCDHTEQRLATLRDSSLLPFLGG